MRIADQWKDYEIIDTSGGEKLERWGEFLLVRPDPQVIWNTPKRNPGWEKKNGHYHRSSKGGGEWEFFQLPEEWEITYKELNEVLDSEKGIKVKECASLTGSCIFENYQNLF